MSLRYWPLRIAHCADGLGTGEKLCGVFMHVARVVKSVNMCM
jgi:hypothetical protein